MWSAYDTLKLGQVHVYIATLPDTVYGSLSVEYHYLITHTTLTAKFFISKIDEVFIYEYVGADAR